MVIPFDNVLNSILEIEGLLNMGESEKQGEKASSVHLYRENL